MKSCSSNWLKRVKIGVWLTAVFCLCCVSGVVAQTLPTPTPDADGVIWVTVQPNDTLWTIAANAGLSLPTLLELNGLSEDAFIQPGDRLIVGYAPTATPTAVAPPTVAPAATPLPTGTAVPEPATGLCLTAFEDRNQNGQREANEPLRASVAFTIFNEQAVVANYVTDGQSEPFCLERMTPGAYQVTRSQARGETLTSKGSQSVLVSSGSLVELVFGSINSSKAAVGQPVERAATAVVPQAAAENGRLSGMVVSLILAGLLIVGLLFFIIKRLYLTRG